MYPDAHGLVDALGQLPCMRSRSTRENSLDSMSGLLLSHGPFGLRWAKSRDPNRESLAI